MKIGGAVTVKNFDLLNRAISSLNRACDTVLVAIDRSSEEQDMIFEECSSKGTAVEFFDFTGFQDANNLVSRILHDKHQCDWIVQLDADEEFCPTQTDMIQSIIENAQGHDAFRIPRRNFSGFRKQDERVYLYPDYQTRIHRWDVTYTWRVHPEIDPSIWNVGTSSKIEIYHYGFAIKSPLDWEQTNQFYGKLLYQDIQDGRVWHGNPRAIVKP